MEEMERNAFSAGRGLAGRGLVGIDRSMLLSSGYDRNKGIVGNACYHCI